MRLCTSFVARHALPAFGFLILTAGTQAQTLNGIHIGEDIATASRIVGRPTSRVAAGPHEEVRWRLSDGNMFALATDPVNGRIAYAEETWGGRPDGKPADFPGFRYGETTLADIRMHAQNNGFAFVERLLDEKPDGLRLFNAYEVEGAPGLVVTFVSRMSTPDTQRLKDKQESIDINRAAKLVGIILGEARYLEAIWGQAKLKGKNYKPIRWTSARTVALKP
ncbi:hypothetical protein [Microvirga lotononidis]|uniref:Uncharacterized protein n=1 Tax=Microvirga lotononidis TaxID=864069 RepID=I4YSH6_9HYPH|nr:hypothetical protein [Microvirga lotononidis]EIM26918.1 hypothetical protein MicloDRAFT_00034710 [Microvirga lotononidis]WQO31467.1 hypothetical protein U0023_34875 [Microvirga lotononidis]